MEPELYGPEAPIRLFTWTYLDPISRQYQTLDTGAVTRDAAFKRARRFLDRQNRMLRRIAKGLRVRVPQDPSQLRLIMPMGG